MMSQAGTFSSRIENAIPAIHFCRSFLVRIIPDFLKILSLKLRSHSIVMARFLQYKSYRINNVANIVYRAVQVVCTAKNVYSIKCNKFIEYSTVLSSKPNELCVSVLHYLIHTVRCYGFFIEYLEHFSKFSCNFSNAFVRTTHCYLIYWMNPIASVTSTAKPLASSVVYVYQYLPCACFSVCYY